MFLYYIIEIKYHFRHVSGNFSCEDCKSLISLEGCPVEVGGSFNCSGCYKLTSLVGGPEKVGGEFKCNDCGSLTSFIGSPEKVGGFSCSGCYKLTSFIGFPKEVVKGFYFANNKISNDPSGKEPYKLYLAMWLELLESVSNEERIEYITNYKDKKNYYYNHPIIPIEIIKEYGY